MANIGRIERRKTNDWILKLDMETKKVADEILLTRMKNGLCSPSGKNKDSYKDIFKASLRDKELVNKLKTWRINKDEK